jgi:hypothetical protein
LSKSDTSQTAVPTCPREEPLQSAQRDHLPPATPNNLDASSITGPEPLSGHLDFTEDSEHEPDGATRRNFGDTSEQSSPDSRHAQDLGADCSTALLEPNYSNSAELEEHHDDSRPVPNNGRRTIPVLQYLSNYFPGPQYKPSSDLLDLWPSIFTETPALDSDTIDQMGKAAYLLCATKSYVDAFDLYYVTFACKFKHFAFAGISMLVAVLDCARTSATQSQDECTVPLLNFALRGCFSAKGCSYMTSGTLLSEIGNLYVDQPKQDCFSAKGSGYVTSRTLPSEIGDLYVDQPKQGKSKIPPNRFSHLYLRDADWDGLLPEQWCRVYTFPSGSSIHVCEGTDSCPRRKMPPMDAVHRVADACQSHKVIEKMLNLCSWVSLKKLDSLDAFIALFPSHKRATKELIRQLLFCHFVDLFYRERYPGPSEVSAWSHDLRKALAGSGIYEEEALSAISSLIVDGCDWDTATFGARRNQSAIGMVAFELFRSIKSMAKNTARTRKNFSAVYLSLLKIHDTTRRGPIYDLPHKVIKTFVRNIASRRLLSRDAWKDARVLEANFVPAPADFPEYIRTMEAFSPMLFTPRSSFSSGARSLRAQYTRILQGSVSALARQSSTTSLSDVSMRSRSSLSFSAITGMPGTRTEFSNAESINNRVQTIDEDTEDEQMEDV